MKRLIPVLVAALVLGACDSGPQAGDLVFILASPNQDDGALAFRVTTDEQREIVTASAACTGCEVFAHSVSATELRGVIVGAIAPGPVLRVTVADVRDRERYTAAVTEAAGRTFALRPAGAYTLTVRTSE